MRYTLGYIHNPGGLTTMHVNDLLRLNGASFIETAYSTILKRQVDRNGLNHFMERLAAGERKETILVSLAKSDEARGSRIDLVGLPALIKRSGKSPWRRFGRFVSDVRNMRRQLARIEHLLSEQARGDAGTAVRYPAQLTHGGKAQAQIPISGDDLSKTLISLQESLSNTAHDADLFIDNFRRTVRSSPLFFAVGH